MALLLRKLYQDPEGAQYFPGGRGPIFSRGGPNANFYRNPYTYLLVSKGVRTPIPLWIRTWAMSS